MHLIPNWLVNLSRPWNQMYRAAWEAMTPRERRVTFFFDVAILIFLIAAVVVMERF